MSPTPFQTQLHDEASQALERKGITFESFADEHTVVISFESVVLTILDTSAYFTSGVLKHAFERKDYQSMEALRGEALAYLDQLTYGNRGTKPG